MTFMALGNNKKKFIFVISHQQMFKKPKWKIFDAKLPSFTCRINGLFYKISKIDFWNVVRKLRPRAITIYKIKNPQRGFSCLLVSQGVKQHRFLKKSLL